MIQLSLEAWMFTGCYVYSTLNCDNSTLLKSDCITLAMLYCLLIIKGKSCWLSLEFENYKTKFIRVERDFACCFVWVWNLVAEVEGRKEAEVVWEYSVEENIWT